MGIYLFLLLLKNIDCGYTLEPSFTFFPYHEVIGNLSTATIAAKYYNYLRGKKSIDLHTHI